jgi:uncharacterized tellurite resistance protein B-like protein
LEVHVDPEVCRSVCRLIAGIVVSDDDLDPAEESFVDRMLASFGISDQGRDAVFPIVDRAEAAAAIRELPVPIQKQAFDLLIEASVADGKLAVEERAYLQAVAAEMGISNTALQKAVAAKLETKG